jgi:hypothetical protein
MTELGQTVAELHDSPVSTASELPDEPTMGMARLRGYLFDETTDVVRRLFTALGSARMDVARSCYSDATWDTDPRPIHGGLALGSVVPLAPSGKTLLAGPEVGRGIPELDLGWLAGELTELEIEFQGTGQNAEVVGSLWPSFYAAYTDAFSGTTDARRVTAARLLRVLLHYCDFVSTYPNLPIGEAQVGVLLWLIDDYVST